jgi:hypothetical protein|tara:strand:+ start:223 stop:486 length:264 start_codon:yes stop_codon:yes gene_type:complete
MGNTHGYRVYVQVLLGPYRGKLFLQEAEDKGAKPSAWMRQIIYDYLKDRYPEDYEEAEIKDALKWQDAIQARVEGRALQRKLRPKAD